MGDTDLETWLERKERGSFLALAGEQSLLHICSTHVCHLQFPPPTPKNIFCGSHLIFTHNTGLRVWGWGAKQRLESHSLPSENLPPDPRNLGRISAPKCPSTPRHNSSIPACEGISTGLGKQRSKLWSHGLFSSVCEPPVSRV